MRSAIHEAFFHPEDISLWQLSTTSDAREAGQMVHQVPSPHHQLISRDPVPTPTATLHTKQSATKIKSYGDVLNNVLIVRLCFDRMVVFEVKINYFIVIKGFGFNFVGKIFGFWTKNLWSCVINHAVVLSPAVTKIFRQSYYK